MTDTNKEKIKELLERGVEEVIKRDELEKKLSSGEVLNVKHGVDPTTNRLHLGYAVVYEKLRQFQELGHNIIFLIGSFTGRFGDPTDQKESRKMRDRKAVEKLAKDYVKQVSKILDIKKTTIRYNGEWYDEMSAEELLKLMSNFTVSKMLSRDMFRKRVKDEREILLHEPVYPVLQGYDSVMLKSDVTVIGSDQRFNELQAHDLQEKAGQSPQDLVIMPLLIGTDGKRKMSQSLGNDIGINEPAGEQFGKVMSIPDNLIVSYFELVTRVSEKEVKKIKQSLIKGENPRDIKARLAFEIAKLYHGEKKAEKAAAEFDRVFKQREMPSDLEIITVKEKRINLIDLLEKASVKSRGEARRLVEQGAVKVDDKKITNWKKDIEVNDGMVVQVGKRRFFKVKT